MGSPGWQDPGKKCDTVDSWRGGGGGLKMDSQAREVSINLSARASFV